MAGTNDFQTFASAGGANVITQSAYLALAAKGTGFQSGIASSPQLNKVWRQSSIIAAMIGQFIADNANVNAVDDGTTATLEANFLLAIQAINQVKLSANLNLYVNPSTGNDANNGLAPSTAFRTIQKAFDVGYGNYNYNRNQLIVNLAAGTYTAGVSLFGLPVGCPAVNLVGNVGSPSTVQLNVTATNAILINSGAYINVSGMTITATGTGGGVVGTGYGVLCSQGWANISNCVFGSCGNAQVVATNSGIVTVATCTFQGSSQYGLLAQAGSLLWMVNTTLTYSSAVYSIGNVVASACGTITALGALFAGSVTGKRYSADLNGTIATNGGGAGFFPGSVAGTTTNGGQYV